MPSEQVESYNKKIIANQIIIKNIDDEIIAT
jgi:hypothetical protein